MEDHHDMLTEGESVCAQDVDIEREVARFVADELVGLTKALGDLAYDLGRDHETLRRHIGSLQAIDLITQIQLALADVLRSRDPLEARVSAITVEALADRMAASLEVARLTSGSGQYL